MPEALYILLEFLNTLVISELILTAFLVTVDFCFADLVPVWLVMRRAVIAFSGCVILLPTVAALRSTDVTTNSALKRSIAQDQQDHQPKKQQQIHQQEKQQPTMSSTADYPVQPAVRLSDTLSSNRALTSFSSLARQHESLEKRLASASDKTTVLAPLNSAVEALPRKAWEDEAQLQSLGADAYEGDEGRARADGNLRRFVERHLVAQSPWPADTKAKTLAGKEVWWEERDGKRVVMPDGVEVDKVAIETGNGQLVSGVVILTVSMSFTLLTDSFHSGFSRVFWNHDFFI